MEEGEIQAGAGGSVIYDLAPQPTGRRGRPAKHGRRLSTESDFTLSDERIGDYYIGMHSGLTNLFGQREVLAYVTASGKAQGSRRLFFSTIFPHQIQMLRIMFMFLMVI